MNNILETNLHLTHAPISIKDFNRIKKAPVLDPELWNEKESLDNASLYIIGKREVPVFVPRREMSDESLTLRWVKHPSVSSSPHRQIQNTL